MEIAETSPVRALKVHLAIKVKNVERSIDFYRKLFGIEPGKVRTGYAKFDVQNPPLNLTLNQTIFDGPGALSHLGIQLGTTGDVLVTQQRWAAAGLATRDEMQTDCCYATQDKTWVRDPDGNEWEAFVVLQDNLPETAGAAVCCSTGQGEEEDRSDGIATASPGETASEATGCCASSAPVGIGR